jgi:hypothetical protein
VIAQLTGQGGDATDRITGGGGDFGGQEEFGSDFSSGSDITSKYRGAQGLDPEVHRRAWKSSSASTSRRCTLRPDDLELSALRFRRELFPRHHGDRPDQGKAAGVDLARASGSR